MFRVEVSMKDGFRDPRGEALQKDIRDLGITTVKQVRVSDTYLLEGNLDETEVRRICEELLADSVVEEYSYNEVPPPQGFHLIEVAYNPGVMDPVQSFGTSGFLTLITSLVLKHDSSLVEPWVHVKAHRYRLMLILLTNNHII